MADTFHMLEQITSGEIYYPERHLINRSDMRHIDAERDNKTGRFTKIGPYTGEVIPEPEEKSLYDMKKKELVEYAMEKFGYEIKLPMNVPEIIDIILGLQEENPGVEG